MENSKAVFEQEISLCTNTFQVQNPGKWKVGGLLDVIRSDTFKGLIQQIRCTEDKHERDKLKVNLPIILWQGLFSEKNDAGLIHLSSIVCIDIDHIEVKKKQALKFALMNEPWVIAFFDSPSGDGLKVLVRTSNYNASIYKNIYRQLIKMFYDRYGVIADPKCEVLSQPCFMSWDQDLFVNPDPTAIDLEYDPFFDKASEKKTEPVEAKIISAPSSVSSSLMYAQPSVCSDCCTDDQIMEILDRRFHRYSMNYTDGYRTMAIFNQAKDLCKAGIPYERAYGYLRRNFLPTGYDEKKLAKQVKRGYEVCDHCAGCERGNYKPYSQYMQEKKDEILQTIECVMFEGYSKGWLKDDGTGKFRQRVYEQGLGFHNGVLPICVVYDSYEDKTYYELVNDDGTGIIRIVDAHNLSEEDLNYIYACMERVESAKLVSKSYI